MTARWLWLLRISTISYLLFLVHIAHLHVLLLSKLRTTPLRLWCWILQNFLRICIPWRFRPYSYMLIPVEKALEDLISFVMTPGDRSTSLVEGRERGTWDQQKPVLVTWLVDGDFSKEKTNMWLLGCWIVSLLFILLGRRRCPVPHLSVSQPSSI